MTALSNRLRSRDGEAPFVRWPDGVLARKALQLTVHPDIPSTERVSICVRSAPALIKLLVALDGRVASLLLLAPELDPETVTALGTEASSDRLISDRDDLAGAEPPDAVVVEADVPAHAAQLTEWILTTSGTTGRPKMVRHRLDSLVRTVRAATDPTHPAIWGLLYEPTRFAGLQVVLQAMLGGGTLAIPSPTDDLGRRLNELAELGCTHLSATPTLWRTILMHPVSQGLELSQVTLGGEIVDEAILRSLRRAFPSARITHIYASTEAGVGFSVHDGHEGFPASFLAAPPSGVEIRIISGRLWVRPPGPKSDYLGSESFQRDTDGFIDTLDRVEVQGDRILFLGRDNGLVNIGGVKVQPEEVERVINRLPAVSLVAVSSRKNSFSGAVLVATVVPSYQVVDHQELKAAVLRHCRANLARESIPALVRIVDRLDINAAGKLARN
jgi:acyl-CoA synthetase (AMP-forming)/AMP-acid ligase II